MATNDLVEVQGTPIVLEANGALTGAGVYTEADDLPIATTDNPGFPFVRFVLEIAYTAGAPTVNSPVGLYKASQNIIGTDDETIPSSSVQAGRLWSVGVASITGAQRWITPPVARDTFHDMKIYFYNGDAASVALGWKLNAIPTTYGPSA